MEAVSAHRFHHLVDVTSVARDDPLQGGKPLESPVFIVGWREITQPQKHIDEGDVSLLVQQCRGNGAKPGLKWWLALCHRQDRL